MTRAAMAALAAALGIAGCAVPGPTALPTPVLELPAADAAPIALASDWWRAFGDVQLDALIDEALAHNRDLERAMARIDEARALLRLAASSRAPSATVGASAGRQRNSETGSMPLGGASPWSNDLRASLDVAYELDLWGRIAAGERSAREELLASEYARATVRVSLAAQVVQSYATLRSLDAQSALFKRAIEAQREALRLQRVRFESGDLSELDIRLLEAELAANEGQLPRLQRALGETERALGLLLGRTPKALVEQGIWRSDGDAHAGLSAGVPAGLPSDLLRRRPDVQLAEARLRAAGARVEVARAAYLPSLSLTGSLGQQSRELSDLFDARSTIFSIVASLTQPIWAGGTLDANRDVALSRQRQLEVDYRDAVSAAFRELRDALSAHDETQVSLRLTETRAWALARASALTTLRFEGGLTSRLEAIEAERAALAAQAQRADARRAVVAAQADVFRVLGGGWAP